MIRSSRDYALPKEEVRRRYNEFAPDYSSMSVFTERVLRVQVLRNRLFTTARGDVLDVACGTGENFRYFGDDARVTAVDLSPGMLAQAQARAAALGKTIETAVMDAEALDFPDDRFDTVVTALSTCTFPDPIAALREMQRVVRPDGRILLVEHGRSSLGLLAHYQDRTAERHYQAVACRWNQEPLDLVQQAGLKVLWSKKAMAGVFTAIEASPNK